MKHKGEWVAISSMEYKCLKSKVEDAFRIDQVKANLYEIGGTSRNTILDERCHHKYPWAAKCLRGFESFKEMLMMINCRFPDIDTTNPP